VRASVMPNSSRACAPHQLHGYLLRERWIEPASDVDRRQVPRRFGASPRRVTSRISTGDGGRVTYDQIFADHSGRGGAEFDNRARVQRPQTAGSY
jgi:hypothetical protein